MANVLLWNFVLSHFHSADVTNPYDPSNTMTRKNLSITPYGACDTIRNIVLHYCAGRNPRYSGVIRMNSVWTRAGGRSFIEPCDAKARMPKSSGIGRNVRTLLGPPLSLSLCSIPVLGNRDAFQGGAQLLSAATLRVLKLRLSHVSRITSGGLRRLPSLISRFSTFLLKM